MGEVASQSFRFRNYETERRRAAMQNSLPHPIWNADDSACRLTHPEPMADAATRPAAERNRSAPPAFAAVDLGTNNCRLLVGAPAGDGFRVLDSFSRVVRLGEGLHHTGRLSPTAMD